MNKQQQQWLADNELVHEAIYTFKFSGSPGQHTFSAVTHAETTDNFTHLRTRDGMFFKINNNKLDYIKIYSEDWK